LGIGKVWPEHEVSNAFHCPPGQFLGPLPGPSQTRAEAVFLTLIVLV